MSIFPASNEGEKNDMPKKPAKIDKQIDAEHVNPNRWVRFLVEFNWNDPTTRIPGRATKCFRAGTEIRLTRDQYQSATAAGVVISIASPGRSGRTE